jgi:hypothetical protein
VSDRKSAIEQALDLFVYAPIGFLAVARDELPRLIERGHQELSNQATVARMMGEYAVGEGRREAGQRLQQASETITAMTSSVAERRRPAGPPPASATSAAAPAAPVAPAPAPPAARAPATPAAPAAPASSGPASSGPASAGPASSGAAGPPSPPPPSMDGLAIPGYDALSASQVVQRLAGLSKEELDAVRDYEVATRGRKTILNRVEQLRAGPSS